jgi:TP901 family phage tail tape measure protein
MPFTPGSENTMAVRVKSEGVGGFRNSMGNATSSLFSFRAAVGAAAGALAAFSTAALAKSASAASDFEEAMVEVEKVTDETTAAALNSEIRDMAAEIPIAQEELAGLTADAARFGIEGTENIRNFTETTAKMATATNLNTDEAGESLAKLAELTNTPIDEVENLGSAVNALSNNFATSAQEVTDSMLRSSAALSQFGLNQRQIAGMSAALNEVSASARRAGTRLRRVAQELMDPKKVEDVSHALGMSTEEFERMRDEEPQKLFLSMAEAMAADGEAANELRQTLSTTSRQALAGLGQNLEGTKEALDASNESYAEASSLQEEFNAATDTFNAKLKLLKNRLKNTAIEIGNVLLPYLTSLVEGINDFLSSGESVINMLSSQEKAWGLVALAIGSTIAAVALLVSGPVAAAVAAVGALGAAFANNFAGIRDVTEETFSKIRELWAVHGEPLREDIQAILSEIQAFWDEWGDEIMTVVNAVMDVISVVIVNSIDTILSRIRIFLALIQGDWKRAWSMFVGLFSRRIERITDLLESWGLPGLAGDKADETVSGFLAPIEPLIREIQEYFGAIVDLWRLHAGPITEEVRETIDPIVKRVRVGLNVMMDIVRTVLGIIGEAWSRWGDEIITYLSFVFDVISTILQTALDAFLTAIRVFLNVLQGDWGEAWEAIEGFIDRTLGRITDLLTEWDITGAIVGFAEGLGQAVKDAFNNALGLPWEHTIGEVSVKGEEVFSGETIGIPALAEGGVVTQPTVALIGESGPERVEPLDKSSGVNINRLVINADSREGGRKAAEGFKRALRSQNIADTGATQ